MKAPDVDMQSEPKKQELAQSKRTSFYIAIFVVLATICNTTFLAFRNGIPTDNFATIACWVFIYAVQLIPLAYLVLMAKLLR
jgi:hypothetical protein